MSNETFLELRQGAQRDVAEWHWVERSKMGCENEMKKEGHGIRDLETHCVPIESCLIVLTSP